MIKLSDFLALSTTSEGVDGVSLSMERGCESCLGRDWTEWQDDEIFCELCGAALNRTYDVPLYQPIPYPFTSYPAR